MMPLDISYGDRAWHLLTAATTVYHAPYGTGCASTGYTLAAGKGVFIIGREYEYYYVYWTVDTSKEMYGYIPITSISGSYNSWIQYDVYRKATCTATTQVLSGPGTTNTYVNIGEIYSGEAPLMVLGKKVNQYNNVTYYFVQYETSAGLVKRGWVDSSLGTVTISTTISYIDLDYSEPFCFVNRATGKALTWGSNNKVVQKTKDGSLEQFFILEKVTSYQYEQGYGYYRIVSAADPTMTLGVENYGYAEGLQIVMQTKGQIDKKQEFLISLTSLNNSQYYASLFTRCTGDYRAVEVYGTSSAENAQIIQSKYVGGLNQQWEILRVTPAWNQTYGQYSGTTSPVNRKVHYDSSLKPYVSIETIRECVNRWNNVYPLSLEVIESGSSYANNCLSTIIAESIDDEDVIGFCGAVQRADDGTLIIYPHETAFKYSNSKWFSTRIRLDFEKLADYTAEDLKGVICHELGHALKMSHTFMHLRNENGSINWNVVKTPMSIMTQTLSMSGTRTPVEIDQYRLVQKWG